MCNERYAMYVRVCTKQGGSRQGLVIDIFKGSPDQARKGDQLYAYQIIIHPRQDLPVTAKQLDNLQQLS